MAKSFWPTHCRNNRRGVIRFRVFLASFSANRLWWLYLCFGFIGGIGLGLSYIVPVSVLVKWFPDRRGLITGIAVGGFGAGALITAPVATGLIQKLVY